MPSDVVLGIVLGGGLGGANAVASLVLWRIGRRRPDRAFYVLVLGGMLVRMMLVLLIVALVIWLVPLDVFAFIGAFFGVFVVGLSIEILQMVRRPAEPRDDPPRS